MLRLQLRQQPLLVTRQLGGRAAKLNTPGDAAPGLDRPGFCHIRGIHQQARRHLEGVKAGIRLLNHFPGNVKRGIPDVDAVAGF